MFCSIDTWRNAFRRAAGEPTGSALPPPRLRPSLATPSRSRRPAASRASAASIGGRAAGEGLVGPAPRTRARGRSRSRGGRASRRRSRRRTRPRRAAGSTGRPRAADAAPNSSVTWRPSRIASSASIRTPAIPRPPATSSRCAAARVDLERPPERPEQVDRVARPQPREPLRARADDPEVDRDDAGRGVGRVERERPAQDHPGEVAGPDVDELAGPRAGRERPARDTPAATGRAGSPGSRPAPPRRAASSRGRLVLRVVVVGARPRRPRRRRRSALAASAPASSASPVAVVGARELGRDRREGLGERVGQVAEDVGRVVELDELVGAGRASATRPRRPRG